MDVDQWKTLSPNINSLHEQLNQGHNLTFACSNYSSWTLWLIFSLLNSCLLLFLVFCVGFLFFLTLAVEPVTKCSPVNNQSLKLLPVKRTSQHYLGSQRCIWMSHKTSVLQTDETIFEMSGHNAQCYIWQKANTAYKHKHLIPAVSTAVVGWWFWLVLQSLDLGSFHLLIQPGPIRPCEIHFFSHDCSNNTIML